MFKRLFDIIFSLLGLIFVSPFILIIAILIKRESPGSAFYLGQRMGKDGKIFKIFKFRSMVMNADKIGGPSTSADDARLLKIGKFLKRHNLDELPQLINVLKGEMSFVGPRPEVPSEVSLYDEETKKIILSVKPGITDLATLENVHEGEILRGAKDPHETYRLFIQPNKLKLAKEYIRRRNFWLDIKIILKTLKSALF
ncbi:MAG: sugar transferase [Candidatus Nealsonbacteria bacterium]|nr:sugar transferase [Candidatus Nealsonbacteria bacterium]